MSINTSMSKLSSYSNISKREKSISKLKKSLAEDNFPTVFSTHCQEAEIKNYPSINILPTEPIPWPVQPIIEWQKPAMPASTARLPQISTEKRLSLPSKTSGEENGKPEILAIYNNPENEGAINMLVYKHLPMQNDLMGALQKTIFNFSSLRGLKLEYCNLTSDQLRAVKSILNHNENIIDLSLDGNPVGYQNHYILLKNTKLQYLSLKFCKINIRGVTKIATYLQYPSAMTLFGLDLSNNFVKDDGCKLLAEALRTNRTLTHLSLANNLITDEGCDYLLEVLLKFSLTHEEIIFRRKCNMEYLLRKLMAIEEANTMKSQEAVPMKPADNSRTERKSRPSIIIKSKKERTSISSSIINSKRFKRKSVISETSETDIAISKDSHPYMHECIAENGEIYCTGNYKLTYLNLAYNNITCNGIKAIKNTLKQQHIAKTLSGGSTGLSRLSLEGNLIKDCRLLKEVTDLLEDEEKLRNVNNRVASAIEFRRNSRKIATIANL